MTPLQAVILCSAIVLSCTGAFADSVSSFDSANKVRILSAAVSASQQTQFRQRIQGGAFVVHSIAQPRQHRAHWLVHQESLIVIEAALVPESDTLSLTGTGIVILFLVFRHRFRASPARGRTA
jgi:hypothetical protein